MYFSYESFWQKTRTYVERAFSEDREKELFPFWASLSFEFLVKATIAYIHPVLVADVKDPANMLYVFGYGLTENPKSIEISTAFNMFKILMPEYFDDKARRRFLSITERRNQELHSGGFAFRELLSQNWLPDYFRFCKILLEFQGKSLIDLFGEEEAHAADQIIDQADEKFTHEINKYIVAVRGEFEKLDSEDQVHRKLIADYEAHAGIDDLAKDLWDKVVSCPACGADARIYGRPIGVSRPFIKDDGGIVQLHTILPVKFRCFSCNLQFNDYKSIQTANLSNQYTVKLPDNFDQDKYLEEVNEIMREIAAENYFEGLKDEGY